MSRRSFARIAAVFSVSAALITFAAVAAGPQEQDAAPARRAEKENHGPDTKTPEVVRDPFGEVAHQARDEVTQQIDKYLESYNLKPYPLPSIPDDSPPHEGAMIDFPLVAGPPDLVLIEVLEALPGRPLSGERLVRPDGTINLGFYGVVHVRGLTLSQMKVAVIKHLRRFLDDEVLGLRGDPNVDAPSPVPPAPAAGNPFEPDPVAKRGEPVPVPVAHPVEARPRFVAPEESDRVFVDITAYNSKNYHITGDVMLAGRLPWTGSESVLDAIEYAGGLLPTAEPKDIRLVRPGRNGKPPRVYKVDLEAIQEKGDVRSNYQLFPGDRLVIGRNDVVKKTIEIDRLHAPLQTIATSIQQNINILRSLDDLPREQDERVLNELVDFWAKEVAGKGDLKFDEQTLREILLRQLKKAPAAPRTRPAPGAK